MLSRLPKFVRSFYFIFLSCFFIWMLFFDANDFISQWRLRNKKQHLLDEKEFYTQQIEEVKKDKQELFSNPALLEKFAREKYLMKKPTEEVYIVVDEKYAD